jgi:hypothetical protein
MMMGGGGGTLHSVATQIIQVLENERDLKASNHVSTNRVKMRLKKGCCRGSMRFSLLSVVVFNRCQRNDLHCTLQYHTQINWCMHPNFERSV